MHIRDWPAAERPRERLLALGSGALAEAELLAIWLRHGTSGMNALAQTDTFLLCNRRKDRKHRITEDTARVQVTAR